MSTKDQDQSGFNVSRRGFLKGVSAGAVATGLMKGTEDTQEAIVEAASPATVGPGDVTVNLNINGDTRKLTVEPRTTLLEALRNRTELTGCKKVCDRATCGACTVLVDDKPIYSCTMLALEAEGTKITTVEGLGTPDNMSDVQESFVENDALQCGFCTPGFVVATTAFVRDNPGASLDEVREGLGGNLCRCGTYVGITEAAYDLAQKAKGGA
jgi:xanthine dehydrogenase YagT iron-sulfur-binding subunit